MKFCKKCNENRPVSDWYVRSSGRMECKKCRKRQSDTDDFRRKSKERMAAYRASNPSANSAACEKYRKKDIEKHRTRALNWYHKNKDRSNATKLIYANKMSREDIGFRLRKNLRTRLAMAIKTGRGASAVKDLGCSIAFLKSYLESQFHSGMSWENYGKEWQIDHIRPLASFDLSDYDQAKEACIYKNLQPLLIIDHVKKTRDDIAQMRIT